MPIRSRLQAMLEPVYRDSPRARKALARIDLAAEQATHLLATKVPAFGRPRPRRIFITLTAKCNLRCMGCLYGVNRFMAGRSLPLPTVRNLLDDAARMGIRNIRLYGGEPMMHRDLPEIVRHASGLGLHTWMTTNGVLLKKKFSQLYDAGLREFSFGFYGVEDDYDWYVRQKNSFRRLVDGLSHVRDTYGSAVKINMDWLLMRPTCNLESLLATWELANRFQTPIYINLVHYSLPYFVASDDRLQFKPEDRPLVEALVGEILALRKEKPELLLNSEAGIRSIPDWLIKGPDMRVPCTENDLIWIGADGTVQMCYVTFKLGNLHSNRLPELLYGPAHRQAARDCVALRCPNCNCSYDKRVSLHAPARRRYSAT